MKLKGLYTYSPASQSFTRLVLTSFTQRLMTIQHEISGLKKERAYKLWAVSPPRSLGPPVVPHPPSQPLVTIGMKYSGE